MPFKPKGYTKAQCGFSLVELVLVMVIIGIAAAASLKYYLELREEAFVTGLEAQARSFAVAIQGARADWLLKRHVGEIPTEPGSKLIVNLDGSLLYVNEKGWPANTSTEFDSSSYSQTSAECYELWVGLMATSVPATVEGVKGFGGERGDRRYHVSESLGNCRYELVGQLDESYFFEYNLTTGKVLTHLKESN